MPGDSGGGPEDTRTIGLVVRSVADPQINAAWTGAVEAARAADVSLICFECGPGDEHGCGVSVLVRPASLDGLIVGPGLARAGFAGAESIPVVYLEERDAVSVVVTVDHAHALRAAIGHLAEQHQRRRIAFVCSAADAAVSQQRYEAYTRALQQRGLSVESDLVVAAEESGEQAVRQLLAEGRIAPDAVIVSSDAMAFDVMRSLVEQGVSVPRDVAVVSLGDGLADPRSRAKLSRVVQPWFGVGQHAVDALVAAWSGEPLSDVAIQGSLVPGVSCGCSSVSDTTTAEVWSARNDAMVAQSEVHDWLERTLLSAASLEELSATLGQGLPALNIPRAFVCRYQDAPGATRWARLVAAWDVDAPPGAIVDPAPYPASQLLPQAVLAQSSAQSLLVQRMSARGCELGYVVSGVADTCPAPYRALANCLSGVAGGLVLAAQVERRGVYLEILAEISRAAAVLRDPDRLLQESVDLLLNRLGLYYAGAFLAERSGRWAMLRAGTGQAGQEMLSRGYKLEVGDGSLVGQCVARGVERVAPADDPPRTMLPNPWLPHTRAEVVVPIPGGTGTRGALSVQSTLPAAFDALDVAALRQVGGHLGDALDGMQQAADLRDSLRQGEALRQIQDTIRDAPDQGALLQGAAKALGEVLGVPVQVVLAAGSWASQSPGGYPIEVNGALVAEFALGVGVRRSLTEEERAVVRAACREVGEALERLQLLERTRARADRERAVREIVDKIEQSPDLEALMRVTAEELAHVLHAHAYVRMGTTDELLRR